MPQLFCGKAVWQAREALREACELGNGLIRLLTLTDGGHVNPLRFERSSGLPALNPPLGAALANHRPATGGSPGREIGPPTKASRYCGLDRISPGRLRPPEMGSPRTSTAPS
jgi:hypothetical protein